MLMMCIWVSKRDTPTTGFGREPWACGICLFWQWILPCDFPAFWPLWLKLWLFLFVQKCNIFQIHSLTKAYLKNCRIVLVGKRPLGSLSPTVSQDHHVPKCHVLKCSGTQHLLLYSCDCSMSHSAMSWNFLGPSICCFTPLTVPLLYMLFDESQNWKTALSVL